jgi:hypothetical protein
MILSLSVASFAVLVAVGVAYLCRHSLRVALRDITSRFNRKDRERASSAAEQFKSTLGDFRRKMQLMEEYSPEYHTSFSSGGWAWLVSTSEHLDTAESIIDAFLASGRDYDAFILSSFLNGDLPHAEMPLASVRFADFVDLLDWQGRTSQQLLQVLEAVRESAELNKEIGLQRSRNRKPTIHVLDELRRQLGK